MTRAATLAALTLALAACTPGASPSPAERYALWRADHPSDVAAYDAWWQQHGLADIAPLARMRDGRIRGAASRAMDAIRPTLDLPSSVNVETLCAFWRTEGPKYRMGLGFYTPTRIHIDTAGFRTWGTDHHRATSLCVSADG